MFFKRCSYNPLLFLLCHQRLFPEDLFPKTKELEAHRLLLCQEEHIAPLTDICDFIEQ